MFHCAMSEGIEFVGLSILTKVVFRVYLDLGERCSRAGSFPFSSQALEMKSQERQGAL